MPILCSTSTSHLPLILPSSFSSLQQFAFALLYFCYLLINCFLPTGKDTLIPFPYTFLFKTSNIEVLYFGLTLSIILYLLYKRLAFAQTVIANLFTTILTTLIKMIFSAPAFTALYILASTELLSIAAAQPHGGSQFKHRAVHARGNVGERNVKTETETVTKYVTVTSGSYGAPTPVVVASPSQTGDDHDSHSSVVTSVIIPSVTTSPASTLATSTTAAASASSSVSSGGTYDLDIDVATGKGVDSNPNTGKDFPDGEIDCDVFPSAYGAIPLTWTTLQGWSGIQVNGGNGDAIGKCTEGALCSYACPAGFSKSQWPADQPASGESHGGLLCKGGKLRLTRPAYPQLCQAGESGVTVRNELGKFVAVCRTDYPGSENMVVPLACEAGSEKQLTVPVSDVSYKWQGKPTSAQYYVNKAGVGIKDGCTWGQEGQGRGNWSPMVSLLCF